MRRVESNNGKNKWAKWAALAPAEGPMPTKFGAALAHRAGPKYAYAIVFLGTLAKALSACGQTTFLGGVMDYIEADMKLRRSTTSLLYSCATLASSLTLPLLGFVMDRIGLRKSGCLNALLMALTCVVLGNLAREPAVLTLFFYLLRFFGQGGMMLIGTNLISNWWIGKRGLMQGISGVGLSLSMTGVFPVLARMSCERLGWRATFTAIGTFVAFAFVPICWLFFLETPELYGLKPDAAKVVESERAQGGRPKSDVGSVEGKTLKEALRTIDFYAATLGGFVWAFNATGVFFHMVSIVETDLGGLEGSRAEGVLGSVYLTCAISSSVLTLLVGWAFDRINPKWIIVLGLLAQSLSIFLWSVDRSVRVTILSAGVFGFSNGCYNNMSGVVHAYLFGRKHIGKISSVAYSSLVIGSALGPLPLGLIEAGNLQAQTRVMQYLCMPCVVVAGFAACCKFRPLISRGGEDASSAGGAGEEEDVEMHRLLGVEEGSGDEDGKL